MAFVDSSDGLSPVSQLSSLLLGSYLLGVSVINLPSISDISPLDPAPVGVLRVVSTALSASGGISS